MKKWALLFSITFALLLAGCGSQEASKQGEEKPAKEEKMTAEEVFEKTNKQSQDMKSFEMNGDLNMKIKTGDETIETNSGFQSKAQMEPLLMFQDMNMDIQDETVNMKMFMDEQYIYMQQPENGKWMKIKQDEGQFAAIMEQQESMNPAQQLEQLKKFADEMKLEEKDDSYILHVKGNGDKLVEMVEEMTAGSAGGTNMGAMMDYMKFEQINYSYIIDKETFQPTGVDLEMKMSLEEGGETVNFEYVMNTTFENINEVKDLKIPEEAKNAEEMQMPEQPQQPVEPQQGEQQEQQQPAS